jgi:hypothetical protein
VICQFDKACENTAEVVRFHPVSTCRLFVCEACAVAIDELVDEAWDLENAKDLDDDTVTLH